MGAGGFAVDLESGQARFALLTRSQRGALTKVPEFSSTSGYPVPESDRLLVWMLRQSVILCRNRAEPGIAEMAAEMTSKGYRRRLSKGWLESNPLTRLALEDEAAYWDAIGVSCQYE